ncbi:glycoside hydrolase family protein [Lachnoclostridium sp. Marseille-P6806]|uniref:glycoside hydrolase family protein n=1 Tax=Lachnoclostridium sp. Marseille-P6806 TaxID=2364793 RepID=UPI001030B7D2|nr:glycoside hydrolase family protein [Lachnoclostridium sp. Marseille-P6806]
MNISDAGLALIKRFEGCRLRAYKAVPAEKYYTIGYGHYGPDVSAGMVITQAQADAYLRQDIARFEAAVGALERTWTQGQNDALVSFAYNCGAGSLKALCNGRDAATIASKMLLYNKAGGKVLAGLVRRRKAEQELFLGGGLPTAEPAASPLGRKTVNVKTVLNVRSGPGANNAVIGSLPPGASVNVNRTENGFSHFEGWVASEYLK